MSKFLVRVIAFRTVIVETEGGAIGAENAAMEELSDFDWSIDSCVCEKELTTPQAVDRALKHGAILITP